MCWLDRRANVKYARQAMLHAIMKGDTPMVSHLLYTQCLDDNDTHDRKLGIECGLSWGPSAEATVVYIDRGMSEGMRFGIARARTAGRRVEYRTVNWLGGIHEGELHLFGIEP
jgi:hypothetical protein